MEWMYAKKIREMNGGMSQTTLWRIKHEMLAIPKYAKGVRGRGRGLQFNNELFTAYMQVRS